ncbi:MAG: hypothetical protein ACT4OX_10315 [Actinomycetota bacterium]
MNALEEWLTRAHSGAPTDWAPEPPLAELHCHPDLVERLAVLARPDRPRRVFVDGCPVVHHPSGPPYAAARGTSSLLVRTRAAPALLTPRPCPFSAEWVAVHPWPPDIAFARGTDQLRRLLHEAFGGAPNRYYGDEGA